MAGLWKDSNENFDNQENLYANVESFKSSKPTTGPTSSRKPIIAEPTRGNGQQVVALPERSRKHKMCLSKQSTIKPGHGIAVRDFKFLPSKERVVITTDSKDYPILLRTFQGKKCGSIAQGLRIDPYGIAVNLQTDDIFVVDNQKNVIMFDCEGYRKQTFTHERFRRIFPITYCQAENLLAIADWDERAVLLADPRANEIVCSFVGDNRRTLVFGSMSWWPTYLTYGNSPGPTISVVDDANQAVKLFDLRGHFQRSVDSPDQQLWSPTCIAMDTGGHLLVMDSRNSKLIRFQNASELDWQVMLKIGVMEGKNWNAIDVTSTGLLGVDTTFLFNDQRVELYKGYEPAGIL